MSGAHRVRIDQVDARVEPSDSSVSQRDDLLGAIRRALPPGRWVRSVHVERDDDGALRVTVERQTVV